MNKTNLFWGILRLLLGWIFLWSFIDKLFGLGFSTCRNIETGVVNIMCKDAWINGGSPTFGFLKFAVKGPFAEFYHGLAGSGLVEWLFMLGLLFVGVTLLLGILVKLGSWAGALMLFLMYIAASIFPEHNPFLDEHIIYLVILIALPFAFAGQNLGFGRWWSNLEIVKKYPILR